MKMDMSVCHDSFPKGGGGGQRWLQPDLPPPGWFKKGTGRLEGRSSDHLVYSMRLGRLDGLGRLRKQYVHDEPCPPPVWACTENSQSSRFLLASREGAGRISVSNLSLGGNGVCIPCLCRCLV